MFDQPSAHHRPDAGRDCAKARPGPDGAAAFVFRKGITNNGQTAGNEKGRAKSLKCAGCDQLVDVRGESARRRRRGKERNADQKNAAPSVVISE